MSIIEFLRTRFDGSRSAIECLEKRLHSPEPEEKPVDDAVDDAVLLLDDLGHEVIVVDRQGAVVIQDQCGALRGNVIQTFNFVAEPNPTLKINVIIIN